MKPYSKYHRNIKNEIEKISKDPKVLFIGQQCVSENFYNFLENISLDKRQEMGVCEELQLGLSVGLALEGYLPISIFQRMDFLPRAADQLINHLDLIIEHSRGLYNPKVIIFTTVGNCKANVGIQHCKNLIKGFRLLCNNIPIYDLKNINDVNKYFKLAIKSENSSILVARQDLFYGD